MNKITFLSLIFFLKIQSIFYRYPVAMLDANNIVIMEQNNCNDVEVLLYNKKENHTTKLLNSWFLPSEIHILPDQSGFSFIDRGQLRIKFFDKKRPHTVNLPIDLFSIHNTSWVQDKQCLFIAKQQLVFRPYLVNISNQEAEILTFANYDQGIHCVYPQKINQKLFMIIKNKENMYSVAKQNWLPRPITNDQSIETPELCIQLQQEPLCFLQMTSEFQGYVLQLEAQKQDDKCFDFTCFQIRQICDNEWEKKPLFVFKILKDMVIGNNKERLFESLLPLLPVYNEKKIIFTNYDQETSLCVVEEFDLVFNRKRILKSSNQHLFACQSAYGLI